MKSSCAPAASSVCYFDFLLKSSIILNNPKQIPLFKLPPTDLYSLILGSSWQFPVSIHFKTDLQNYPKTIHRVIPQSFREHKCRGKWAKRFAEDGKGCLLSTALFSSCRSWSWNFRGPQPKWINVFFSEARQGREFSKCSH